MILVNIIITLTCQLSHGLWA